MSHDADETKTWQMAAGSGCEKAGHTCEASNDSVLYLEARGELRYAWSGSAR